MNQNELVKIALEAMNRAYAPYSNFSVGAAVLTSGGKVYTGANIENASYGATVCAERTAIFKAVSEGETKIEKLAVASISEDITLPCGICRQVIAEFGTPDTEIICASRDGNYKVFTLNELLPHAFKL